MLHVFRTSRGTVLKAQEQYLLLEPFDFDELFRCRDPRAYLGEAARCAPPLAQPLSPAELLPPIGCQEVWAAGVTYFRSRSARMEESNDAGDCYDKVYSAPRPELFLKATPHRVVGCGQDIRIRADAVWNVPEPELTLCVSSAGRIFGYTAGNDMSSRDLEGENPLYLPQAKVYDQCCGLGPGILLVPEPLPQSTPIKLSVRRSAAIVFSAAAPLAQMKRQPRELVDYLFRDNSFPSGCFLMTGTGIVPPSDFTLQAGDAVEITIEPIGTLTNHVVCSPG